MEDGTQKEFRASNLRISQAMSHIMLRTSQSALTCSHTDLPA